MTLNINTAKPSQFWRGKSVLVTGGAGFIGSHIVPALLSAGARVRVADNLERGSRDMLHAVINEIDFRCCDLREEGVARAVANAVDVVIHLASKVGGIGYYVSHPYDVFEANVRMDSFVQDAIISNEVPYYFYASSAHVYPIELQRAADSPPISEPQVLPAHPELSYGWAKLMGEKRLEFARSQGVDTRVAIARLIGAYGPNQDFDLASGSAIPVFIRRAIEYPARRPFRVLGTGRETRSFCYITDVVRGILLATELLEETTTVGPFNLGSTSRVSISDIAQTVVEISGKNIEIEYDLSHPTVIWGQALDCTLATRLLREWCPVVTMRQGLEMCYRDIERRLSLTTLSS